MQSYTFLFLRYFERFRYYQFDWVIYGLSWVFQAGRNYNKDNDDEKTDISLNPDKARLGLDPKLFKKLTDNIWEFRTKYGGLQYRLFAFWDRTGEKETLVISTHGMVKKTDKVSKSEIEKAGQIRTEYFGQ